MLHLLQADDGDIAEDEDADTVYQKEQPDEAH